MAYSGEKRSLYFSRPHEMDHDRASGAVDVSLELENERWHTHALGRIATIGHSLADSETINVAFRRSLETDAVDPLVELSGSFSGVIAQPDKVTAFSDLAGQFPLYYTRRPEGVALSTSAYELAKNTGGELDLATLAAHICGMYALTEGHSSFQNINRLMGGNQLHVTENGLQVAPYQPLTPDPSVSIADSVIATRKSIIEAMESRKIHRLSTDFSGGIDSTSLGFAAVAIGSQDLPSFVHHSPSYPAGDIAYARRFALLNPRIKLHELQATDAMLPYGELEPSDILFLPDEPYRGVSLLGRERARQRVIGEFQSTVHLNGIGGDALYDGRPYAADLLRRGELERATQTAVTLARTYLGSPEVLLERARKQAEATLPQAFEFLAEVLIDPSRRKFFNTGWLPRLGEGVEWLTPTAREALAMRASEAAAQEVSESMGIGDYNIINEVRDSGDAQRHQRYLMGDTFELHAPFLDNNVITAAANLNSADRNQAGRFKFLLREALSGHLVPEQIYEQRQGKGNYTAEMYEGIRRAMPDILALLDNSQLAALGVIEPTAVRRTLASLDTAATFPFGGLAQLVATEIWLRQRSALNDTTQPFVKSPDSKDAAPQGETSTQIMDILSHSYVLPAHLSFAPGPDQLVIFNQVTESLEIGNSTTDLILRALNETGDPMVAVCQLANAYPHISKLQLQTDVAILLQGMLKEGLLMEGGHVSPRDIPNWTPPLRADSDATIGEMMRVRTLRPEEMFELSQVERRMGEAALRKVFELKEGSFNATRELLAKMRRQNTRDASEQEAHRNLAIAHRVSGAVGRVACYERSLAAVLLGAARRTSTDWVIGTAFDPPHFHAWPEVNGTPIVTGADEPVAGVYQSWIRS